MSPARRALPPRVADAVRRASGPRFPCPRCGTPLGRTAGETPRKIGCPRCAFLIYDYPRACAGFVVIKDDTTLVLRRGHMPKRGFLDIPGGFIEANEPLEAAARRELLEETSLQIRRAEWLGFYWDEYFLKGFGRFPTMNFYFIGRWSGGEPVAGDDAAAAEWVKLAHLGRAQYRFAWKHIPELFRDVRKWVKANP